MIRYLNDLTNKEKIKMNFLLRGDKDSCVGSMKRSVFAGCEMYDR